MICCLLKSNTFCLVEKTGYEEKFAIFPPFIIIHHYEHEFFEAEGFGASVFPRGYQLGRGEVYLFSFIQMAEKVCKDNFVSSPNKDKKYIYLKCKNY